MNKQHATNRPGSGQSRPRGFTLIELMMTIGVLAILMAVAGPSFVEIIRNNRVATQTNDVVGALSLARNEAAKRGLPVTVCAATADQSACAGDATEDWANGWLTFVDSTGTAGTLDAGPNGDILLQTSRRPDPSVALRTDSRGFVRYGRSGAPTNAAAFAPGAAVIIFQVHHTSCVPADSRGLRILTVDRTGRAGLVRQACV